MTELFLEMGSGDIPHRPKRKRTPRPGKEHIPEGFPHYTNNRRRLGYCMCLQECCHGPSGCICKGCRCMGKGHEHETQANNAA